MTPVNLLLVTVIGYLLGAISFAVLIARIKGVDILNFGSGNPGATNVTRALGSKWGRLVFALDAFKGFAATAWPPAFLPESGPELATLGLLAALIGHSCSVFLKFRGGKGVAVTMGGLLALMPPILLIGLSLWGIIFLLSRMVALASILFAASLPISAFAFYGAGDIRFILGLILGIIIIIRHRSNIARMIKGSENSFRR